MRRFITASCLLLAGLLGQASMAWANEPIIIRFSHVVADSTPKGQGALLFQKLVHERLGGKVKVEVYPNSSLFGDADELAALQNNEVQILAPSMAKFSNLSPGVQVFDLPFLFDDQAAVERFERRPHGKALLLSMVDQNIVGLAFWHNGMKQLSSSRPLQKPSDAQNLTFRIQPSSVLEAQFHAVGANSARLPFSQLRDALINGKVHGAENPWSNIHSQQLDQLQPWITESNHGFLNYMLVTNPRFWYSLPYQTRSELEVIIDEVSWSVNQAAQKLNAHDRDRVLEAGKAQLVTLSAEERAAWRQAMRPVWRRFREQIGDELIQAAIRSNGI